MSTSRPSVLQVTHYIPPHNGGIERVADALFDGYRAAGLDVVWVGSRVPPDTPEFDSGKRRVRTLNVLETRLSVPIPIWGVDAVRALRAAVASADVVHVHDCLYPGSALAVRLARSRGRPTLLTQHVGFVKYRSGLLNAVEQAAYATLGKSLLRQVDRLVLATPAARGHVEALLNGLPADAVSIPNGIDLRRFAIADDDRRRAAQRTIGVSADSPVALFVGRLVQKKGVPLVVEAASRLPHVQFVLVGDGPLAPLVERGPRNIRWVRTVAPSSMPAYYESSDCLVLPSEGEGLPLVVQEAMACGVAPIISSDEPYAGDLMAAGVALGVARDPAAIASTIGVASSNAARLRQACRRYAESIWNIETMVGRYVTLVRELAGAHKSN